MKKELLIELCEHLEQSLNSFDSSQGGTAIRGRNKVHLISRTYHGIPKNTLLMELRVNETPVFKGTVYFDLEDDFQILEDQMVARMICDIFAYGVMGAYNEIQRSLITRYRDM